MKFSLDLATRTVDLPSAFEEKNKEKLMKGVNKLLDSTEHRFPRSLFSSDKAALISEITRKVSRCGNQFAL